ncbi:MAG: DUF429 domain-containing protein [Thermoplasmata archaeon]
MAGRAVSTLVLGLDLAGSPRRSTGCCVLSGRSKVRASVAFTDQELRDLVDATRPALIVIDAPLSLPRGRRTIEDRSGPHLRECDRELLRRRIRFFPLTLGPMRMLTERGMRLAAEWRRAGYDVVEGYPGASQDILRIPRKNAGLLPLKRGLRHLGLEGDLVRRALTHDELDAVTIAWVGRAHLAGRSVVIGDPTEGLMVLPAALPPPRRRAKGVAERARAGTRKGWVRSSGPNPKGALTSP